MRAAWVIPGLCYITGVVCSGGFQNSRWPDPSLSSPTARLPVIQLTSYQRLFHRCHHASNLACWHLMQQLNATQSFKPVTALPGVCTLLKRKSWNIWLSQKYLTFKSIWRTNIRVVWSFKWPFPPCNCDCVWWRQGWCLDLIISMKG